MIVAYKLFAFDKDGKVLYEKIKVKKSLTSMEVQ